jgi:hypothetical protein
MRFFGGLTVEENAEALGVSPPTVMRGWRSHARGLHASWWRRVIPPEYQSEKSNPS